MAATVPVETAGEISSVMEWAQTIGAPPTASAEAGPAEPAAGSYERFLSSFGAPQRWAGH